MRFCMNCGKEVSDSAVFCTGCGANIGTAPNRDTAGPGEIGSTVITAQADKEGAYYQTVTQSTQGSVPYTQPGAQSPQGAPYYQPGMQNTQGNVPNPQPGAQGAQGAPQYFQPGVQGGQNAAYYPNAPYAGGSPGYPGGPGKNNKTLVVIVSVIIGLVLIGGGILAYFLITGKDKVDDPSASVTGISEPSEIPLVEPSEIPLAEPSEVPLAEPSEVPSVKPSIEPSEEPTPAPSSEPSAKPSEKPATLDETTLANIETACLDTGMDISKMSSLEYYGVWYEGAVYTFTYKGSVVDVLLYEDGTVFSIETAGAQIYLISYDSYYMDDYTGSQTHFDESYPDSSYVFFMDRELLDVDASYITIETSYDLDYVVELIDAYTGYMAIAFYVQAGQSIPMPVPSGDYVIQYAAGPYWISISEMFGADTVFFRSDSTYSVSADNEPLITLDVNSGSGIPSTEITYNDF